MLWNLISPKNLSQNVVTFGDIISQSKS
uniref:Uncharacterized protein n=1 Tax=Rhizophora mucronata TaxID=61149 RepID=A0A2P2PFN4_RHIMU